MSWTWTILEGYRQLNQKGLPCVKDFFPTIILCNGRIKRRMLQGREGKCSSCCFSCEFLPHFFVETRSWMRTWVGKPHSRPRREMVLLSGILSRNVGSVEAQSWTGGFSSTQGKRHIGKVIPPVLAHWASVGGTRRGRQPDLRILMPFTAQTWSPHSCTVKLLFHMTFPVPGFPIGCSLDLVLTSNPLGQQPSDNFQIQEGDCHFL